MLNELYDLAQCLQSAKISMDSRDGRFIPCPTTKPTYLVTLDTSGQLVDIRLLDRELISTIRTSKGENGVSFPSFNVPPLYMPKNDEAKQIATELRKLLVTKSPQSDNAIACELESLIGKSRSLWLPSRMAKINKSVTLHAQKLATILGLPPTEYSAIAKLISRASCLTPDSLHCQLQKLLIHAIATSASDTAKCFDFLVCSKKPKEVCLILELADCSQFQYPANHSRVQAWMNQRFLDDAEAQLPAKDSSAKVNPDSYANPAVQLRHKFPAVRLPILGDVILRAMSSESPCQRRYGFADSDSYPVGRISRQQMKNALEWLGKSERQNRTWADARGTCGYTKRDGKKVPISAILFAYPTSLPEECPEIAGLLAGDIDASARFEQYAVPVVSALQGLVRTTPDVEVHVFVLMKADKARTKVVQSRSFSAKHLIKSDSEWQKCVQNIPTVKIRQFGVQKKDKPVWADPFTPFPAEVVDCLNIAWERKGKHGEPVSDFSIGDGLGLLLEQGSTLHVIASRAIHAAVTNSLGLLLALRQMDYRGKVHPDGKKYAKHPLLLPSILGLLLAKLGRWKGDYMKGPPFLVGRLLSLADQLHLRYCHGVRKGQIPPQLVGNALMPTALEQPAKALALLSQRILPYQAWANTVQNGDNVGLAKYLLGQFGRVSAELKEFEVPTTCSDTDKAEMLLGYLAHAEKDDDNDATSTQ